MADYAVTLLLDVLRRVFVADRFVRSGLWPQMGEYPLGRKVSFYLFIFIWVLSFFSTSGLVAFFG